MERRTLVTIILLALFAMLGQILVWFLRAQERPPAFVGPPRSDYTLSNYSIDALDEEGKLSFTVVGPRLTHKEDDGSVELDTPKYVMVDNSGNLWKGNSDAAWVNKDGSIMKLEGKVDMHRVPTATVTPVQLLTTDLTVTTTPKDKKSTEPKPKQMRMETAKLATIIDPNHVVHGVGMKANLEGLKDMELQSDVHWIIQPANHDQTKP